MYFNRHSTAFGVTASANGVVAITTDTHIIEHSCQLCELSDWYFTTPFDSWVYLKVGWNRFGRSNYNNIEIDYDGLQPTEFAIETIDPFSPPIVYDISGNILLNYSFLGYTASDIAHGSCVGIFAPNKMIMFQFFNAMD